MAKIRLGGIKLSEELVQFSFVSKRAGTEQLTALLARLTDRKVNIPLLWLSHSPAASHHSFCTAENDAGWVAGMIGLATGSSDHCPTRERLGSLSLFPHNFSLAVLHRILALLHQAEIPVYSLTSSLSALVILTDSCLLDGAIGALQQGFLLPDNHAPFRTPQEPPESDPSATAQRHDTPLATAAVYWEPTIQIYDMSLQRGLSLLHLQLPASSETAPLSPLPEWSGTFILAGAQRGQDNSLHLDVLLPAEAAQTLLRDIKRREPGNKQLRVVGEESGVEVVSFFGPHFQERYGIIHTAIAALRSCNLPLLAAGCSGTSVYLVLPEDGGPRAMHSLAECFTIPRQPV